jgi:hypothetical protein
MKDNLLLNLHIEEASVMGFWDETFKTTIIKAVEQRYNNEILTVWGIEDIVMVGEEKSIIKWYKRFKPLTEEDLKNKYGR